MLLGILDDLLFDETEFQECDVEIKEDAEPPRIMFDATHPGPGGKTDLALLIRDESVTLPGHLEDSNAESLIRDALTDYETIDSDIDIEYLG